MVMAEVNARKGEADFPPIDTIYYEEHVRLRITITGSLVLTYELLRMIDVLLHRRHRLLDFLVECEHPGQANPSRQRTLPAGCCRFGPCQNGGSPGGIARVLRLSQGVRH
jgi:hypothetical protein